MIDNELMEKIKFIKENQGYTLNDLSRKLDIQITTLARWLKTGRINKIYAKIVREKLEIK